MLVMQEFYLRVFRNVWNLLARDGFCDTIDGQEYRRVLAEFIRAGYPFPCAAFIRERANIGARGEPCPELIDLRRRAQAGE